jgi:energy-coupling factor transporter ATP-binding protein EcfA2
MLWFTGLGEARYRPVEEFSTGMRQRTKLAMALVHDPDLLLLDEPTSGLDPSGRRQMLDLVREIGRRGISVLLSTHLLHDVEDVCERVVLLHRGRLVLGAVYRALSILGWVTRSGCARRSPAASAEAREPWDRDRRRARRPSRVALRSLDRLLFEAAESVAGSAHASLREESRGSFLTAVGEGTVGEFNAALRPVVPKIRGASNLRFRRSFASPDPPRAFSPAALVPAAPRGAGSGGGARAQIYVARQFPGARILHHHPETWREFLGTASALSPGGAGEPRDRGFRDRSISPRALSPSISRSRSRASTTFLERRYR